VNDAFPIVAAIYRKSPSKPKGSEHSEFSKTRFAKVSQAGHARESQIYVKYFAAGFLASILQEGSLATIPLIEAQLGPKFVYPHRIPRKIHRRWLILGLQQGISTS